MHTQGMNLMPKTCSEAERFSMPTGEREIYKNPPQRPTPLGGYAQGQKRLLPAVDKESGQHMEYRYRVYEFM